jgi:methyl-accepting chemotaxis protein
MGIESHTAGKPAQPGELGEIVLRHVGELRQRVAARVREVTSVTGKEVLGAGSDVNVIIHEASEHISRLRQLLSGGSGGSLPGDDLGMAVDRELGRVGGFVEQLRKQVTEQLRLAETAERSLSDINRAATQVSSFAERAKMLSLNARIEASRISVGAEGFAVIANEMKELSRSVAETNASIQQMANALVELLPSITRGASEMHSRSQAFSVELGNSMREMSARAGERRLEVSEAVRESDRTLAKIVSTSQSALSHLQFEDTVAQALMRLDAIAADTEVTLCRLFGLDSRIEKLAKPTHHELGGDKPVIQQAAGDVVLF